MDAVGSVHVPGARRSVEARARGGGPAARGMGGGIVATQVRLGLYDDGAGGTAADAGNDCRPEEVGSHDLGGATEGPVGERPHPPVLGRDRVRFFAAGSPSPLPAGTRAAAFGGGPFVAGARPRRRA